MDEVTGPRDSRDESTRNLVHFAKLKLERSTTGNFNHEIFLSEHAADELPSIIAGWNLLAAAMRQQFTDGCGFGGSCR